MNLPILTCSYCMRKVGLWNFHQMEGTGSDSEPNIVGQSAQATGPALAATHEGQGDQPASASPTPTTPCRMKLRSQDSTRTDQASFKQMKVDLLNKIGLLICIHHF